jgi:hypothetical protein
MKINLIKDEHLIIEYKEDKNTAKFYFKNDSRLIYDLAIKGFTAEAVADCAKKSLLKIEGLETEEAEVKAEHFELLPIKIYVQILTDFKDKVIKNLVEETDTKKKKK